MNHGKNKHKWIRHVAFVSLPFLLFAADIATGASGLGVGEVFKAITGGEVTEETRTIVIDIRLMKALTAALAGTALSLSGLMMQTLFQNPLAGPYVLGVSSGASLGAAVYVLGASSLAISVGDSALGTLGLAGAAWIGTALTLLAIAVAGRRVKDIMVILILGMTLGSGIDACVQVLQYLSDENALKSYVIWTMGSLSMVSGTRMWILAASTLSGLALAALSVKRLNLLLLGENYAVTMGMDPKRTRRVILIATVLLAGTATAFCGPLGFIGLAVPHICRSLTGEADHGVLIPACVSLGASLTLACDILAKNAALPINAVTSLSGIPVVIWIVIKYRNS